MPDHPEGATMTPRREKEIRSMAAYFSQSNDSRIVQGSQYLCELLAELDATRALLSTERQAREQAERERERMFTELLDSSNKIVNLRAKVEKQQIDLAE